MVVVDATKLVRLDLVAALRTRKEGRLDFSMSIFERRGTT
jgi:hypothetical protein